MSLYRDRIFPWLLNCAMRQERFVPYRKRLIWPARGLVLEIGIGSGVNLPFYPEPAQVIGLEPSRALLTMARRTQRHPGRLLLVQGSAEQIPLRDASVDTVVVAWTLCSIPDVSSALAEMRRVLRPGGGLLFVEHGRSPDAAVARWQDRLTPLWRRVSGGCHLNRPVRQLIEDAGFRIERLDAAYMAGPRMMTYMYEGEATPRP